MSAQVSIEQLYQHFLSSSGVTTDTRKLTAGSIFFALKGANFDGNEFVSQALQADVNIAITDHADNLKLDPDRVILVNDVLDTLQQLARHHRRALGLKVVAVCGSNGKTTTKELLSLVLATKFKTFATPGNLNNHIGVPLSILQLDATHEVAVLELGANHPGEIKVLCDTAEPDMGFITNVGKDHLEGFGSVEGVARANGELFDFLLAHGGQVFANVKEGLVLELTKPFVNVLTYPTDGTSYPCKLVDSSGYIKVSDYTGGLIETRLVGAYNLDNIATALAVGAYLGVDPEAARAAVASYQPANMRSQIVEATRNTILLDAYNANPSSMSLALENLDIMNWYDKPKAFIIGDMFELGPDELAEHVAIGHLASRLQTISIKIFVGNLMKHAADACPNSHWFQSHDQAIAFIKQENLSDHFILLKGSRGMRMEKLQEVL